MSITESNSENMEILRIQDIYVSYGPIEVLHGVSLVVREGSVVALIGPNGAGKTTLLRTVSGLNHPSRGSIVFMRDRIDRLPPEEVVRRGLAHAPEGREVFRNLTVFENLRMGGFSRHNKEKVASEIERMYSVFPVLRERRKQLAGTLSGGEQQMLAIARALVSRPKLLLLDEPSMGLAPVLVDNVVETLVRINEGGVAILLVEQNAHVALLIADRGYVLEEGVIAVEGKAASLLDDERIKRSYLGV